MKSLQVGENLKIGLILFGLLILRALVPAHPIDPWGLLNLKNVVQMILAITLVQTLGIVLVRQWGTKIGLVATGFLGG